MADEKAVSKTGLAYLWSGIKTYLSNNYAKKSHTHSNATTSAAGLMSASDKAKLDGMEAGVDIDCGTF